MTTVTGGGPSDLAYLILSSAAFTGLAVLLRVLVLTLRKKATS